MKIMFTAKIKGFAYPMEVSEPVPVEHVITNENPETLLSALVFVNGTKRPTPTVNELLYHLFVRGAAYAGMNYLITIDVVE